ncbi:MAG: DUF6125 family protein [Ignavibacteria bacterium]|nr:DUF6125 family protein [Ignavibacteria bacterium]
MAVFDDLSREDLLKLIEVYAKNWLAHDGCWFLAAEETLGLDSAIDLDTKAWDRFAVTEARRIMKEFNIPAGSGLKGLERAFAYRLYAAINKQSVEWIDEHTMVFRMVECRVQKTRMEKNLPAFPCKSVGIVEFSQFARTVDERIRTQCISCPPDRKGDSSCVWQFSIDPEQFKVRNHG